MNAFTTRYNFSIPLESQPSDNTLLLVAKMHDRKSGEFVPLSKVSGPAEVRDIKLEPTRIKGRRYFWAKIFPTTAQNLISSHRLNRFFTPSVFCCIRMHWFRHAAPQNERGVLLPRLFPTFRPSNRCRERTRKRITPFKTASKKRKCPYERNGHESYKLTPVYL